MAVIVVGLLLLGPLLGPLISTPTPTAGRPAGEHRSRIFATPPTYGYNERTYALPGFNSLSGYFPTSSVLGLGYQIPTLSAAYARSFGIYYVDNSSNFVEFQLVNNTTRTVAHVIPLYQLFGYGTAFSGMVDNEFFIEFGYDQALFYGTTTSTTKTYSLELVNLTTGQLRMWNTSAPTDSSNQQVDYVGNNTVLVLSSNCTIYAWNLASRLVWFAGTMGANFGSGTTCFEANNAYWFPQKHQLISIEAHGDTGDHVEQLNATYNSKGQIQFTSVATIAVDANTVFNWVDGLAYNASTNRIAFTSGYWVTGPVNTYDVPYSAQGLLTATGEIRYTAYNGGGPTGKMIEIGQNIYTSDYVMGEARGPNWWPNATQFLFDPWNGSELLANHSINHVMFGNSGFEGQYPASPAFLLDYNATLTLNSPMYRVVYGYHGSFTPFPGLGEELIPSSGPNRTLLSVSAIGLVPNVKYDYCWTANASAIGCPAKLNFTSTASGQIPAGVNLTRVGGTAWLAISRGASSANFTISSRFVVTKANLTLSPKSGPNRTLVGLVGTGFAPGTRYDYCWVGNGSAAACPTKLNFTTDASGALPKAVGTTRSGGNAWIAVSQGTSVTNYIVSAPFNLTTANVSLSPRTGPNGTLVTLFGLGYGVSTAYNFCWSTSSAAVGCSATQSFTANKTGGIPNSVTATRTGGSGWLAISQGTSSANFIVSTSFNTTVANLSLTPKGGPNGTAVRLSGSGLAAGAGYDYCLVASSSAVGCGAQNTFTSSGAGGVPSGVTIDWSGGDGWLAVSQGPAAANYIGSAPFALTTATLTLTPAAGPAGTEVSVTGGGLVPATTYDYCGSTGTGPTGCPTTASFTSTATGAIPAGLAFPWPGGSTYLAVSEGASSANFILAAPFRLTTPILSMTPGRGPPGSLVALNSTGLVPNTVYDYCWSATFSNVGCPATNTFTSTGAGAIPSGVTTSWAGGNAWLAISEGPSASNFIEANFFTATTASLVLGPSSGPNRTMVSLAGTGFASLTSYDLCWSATSAPIGCSATDTFTTDASGSVPPGIGITWTGATNGWLAVSQGPSPANFIVPAAFTVTSASVTVTPSSGPNGTHVSLSGAGFAPSTRYDFCWAGSASATSCPQGFNFTSTPSGSIPLGVRSMETGSQGWLALSQGTSVANYIASAGFTVTVPRLALTPALGPARSMVTLGGSGLAPGALYDYCFGASASSACPNANNTFTADATGAVPSGTVLRAPATANRHVVLSEGPLDPIALIGFTVTVPAARLTVLGGPANAVTSVVGSGFAALGAVSVMVGGENVSAFAACPQGSSQGATITANASGGFACSFHVPGDLRSGSDAVVVTDLGSGAPVRALFDVTVPKLTLSALSGMAGDSVFANGTGFDRGGNVTLALGSLALATLGSCTIGAHAGPSIVVGLAGEFSCAFTLPSNAPAGTYALAATGTVSGASAAVNFTVLPPAGHASPSIGVLSLPIVLGLIAVVAAAIVVGILVARRRGRGPPVETTDSETPAESFEEEIPLEEPVPPEGEALAPPEEPPADPS